MLLIAKKEHLQNIVDYRTGGGPKENEKNIRFQGKWGSNSNIIYQSGFVLFCKTGPWKTVKENQKTPLRSILLFNSSKAYKNMKDGKERKTIFPNILSYVFWVISESGNAWWLWCLGGRTHATYWRNLWICFV